MDTPEDISLFREKTQMNLINEKLEEEPPTISATRNTLS